MNRLGRSFIARFILYLVMLVSIMLTAVAGTIAACNIDYNWYSDRSDAVEDEIYSEVAEYVGSILYDYAYYSEGNEEIDNAQTLIYGEDRAENFGYGLYRAVDAEADAANGETPAEVKWEPVKEINIGLGKEEGIHHETIQHDGYVKIEVYLGDMEKGGVPNEVGYLYDLYKFIYANRNVAAVTAALAALVSFALFVILICAAGRDKEKESVTARLPLDVIVAIAALLLTIIVTTVAYADSGITVINYIELTMIICALALVVAVIVTGTILIFAVQLKAGGWWRHMLLYKVGALVVKGLAVLLGVFRHIDLVWKTGLTVFAGIFINFIIMIIAMTGAASVAMTMWLVGAVVTAAAVIYTALCMKRLEEGGRHLAEGDMGYKTDTKGLFLDFKDHGDDLNDIGRGMANAVEERLKSERFKTELITNVSHDIKTPITSMINYVDLLKREDIDNEKAREYIEVLERQSQRLKKLTEDLVEASKAATGNVTLDLMPCDVAVMMNQAMGEYREKAEAAGLDMIMDLPAESVSIMADGRSMWRVLDNLMNNICKYSQPGTRVYQSLEIEDGKAVMIYRNTSKYALNISEEELTERFVRGDSSRHTEGSGLGLSIAKNLVELQGGRFDIYIDGDLFKTIIRFDII